jgi:mRNA interferase HigB
MRVIAWKTLAKYLETRRDVADYKALKGALEAWYAETESATWANPAEIQRQYRTASIVGNERVVFNIIGNNYRLIVAVLYKKQIVFIKWIGTHREYDKIDVATVSYEG